MKNKKVLYGTWTGGADDGSGLRQMVYNFGITFLENGTGTSFYWSTDADGTTEIKNPIEWDVLGKNKMQIRNIDESSKPGAWEIIDFEISDFIGAYDSQYFKLAEKGKESFFGFPEPLYKPRVLHKKANKIFGRLFRFFGSKT